MRAPANPATSRRTWPAPFPSPSSCAGISVDAITPVASTGLAAWQDTMTVNTLAAAELTRLMLPALRRSQGHVLFLNSARGVRAVPGWSAFAASKAALTGRDGLRATRR
jgi:NAD(P)-dependent dehydrogenase (short-subunit alcohol dehydrogenase family)